MNEILQFVADLDHLATEKKVSLVKGSSEYEYYQGVADTARKVMALVMNRELLPGCLLSPNRQRIDDLCFIVGAENLDDGCCPYCGGSVKEVTIG